MLDCAPELGATVGVMSGPDRSRACARRLVGTEATRAAMRVRCPAAMLRPAISTVLLTAAIALAGAGGAGAAGIDGPGTYAVFRTLDSGSDPTPEQNRRCDGYFGAARGLTAAIRLDARLFAFRADPMTGRVVDQTAGYLGPGFICGAPASNSDAFEAFAYTGLPDIGEAEADGPCSFAPVTARPGALFFNCRLQARPNPELGLLGGVVTGNSIVNPGNVAPGAPTGSIWTAYLVPKPGVKPPPYEPPAAPVPPLPSTEGLDFYVLRSFDAAIADGSAECQAAGAQDVTGARSSALATVQPAMRNSVLDPNELLYRDASATLCFSGSGDVTALITLKRGGQPVRIVATGDCHSLPTPAGENLRQQTCRLPIGSATAPGASGGLVTTTGLVPADAPLRAANSHIWTIALFADPASDPVEKTAPRVTLRVPRRTRRTRVRARWTGSDAESGVHHYQLEVRRRARGQTWRTVAQATTTTSATLRLRRGSRYLVRARAVDRAGNIGPWVRRATRVRR